MRRRDGRLPLASKDKNVSTSISSGNKIANSGGNAADLVKGTLLGLSEYDTKSVRKGNNSGAVIKSELLGSSDLLSIPGNEKQSTSESESYSRLKHLILRDRDGDGDRDTTGGSLAVTRKQTRTRIPEDYDREIEFVPKKYDEIPYVPDDYSPLDESHIQKLREFHSDALFKDFGDYDQDKDQGEGNNDIQQPDGLLKLEVFHDASDSESDSGKDQDKIQINVDTPEVRSEDRRNLVATRRQRVSNKNHISKLKGMLEPPDLSSEPVELDPIYNGQGLSPDDLEELLLD